MVKYATFLFLLLSPLLFCGEFTASVSQNQVNLGESFTLNLTLKAASPKIAPSIESLKKTFFIHSQQQSSHTLIMNGQLISSTTWKFVLTPQEEGEATIPPISVDTSEGVLTSQSIVIGVTKGSSADSHSSIDGVTLKTDVSHAKPYKNEPIFYTITVSSPKSLANLQVQKFNVENALVEINGEPKVFEKMINGIRVGVAEFNYLITPLKAGSLKIPSTIIQGAISEPKKMHPRSLFNDDFDFFSLMQGFDQLTPFSMLTEEMILDVQPAIVDMSPWLPAKSLKIEELFDESEPFQVGEFFNRRFKITAEGINSAQLPSLDVLPSTDKMFKIYADKPELADEIKEGRLQSSRNESYTLIPQQAGTLTLPEISVTWWDVVNKERVTTKVPSRVLSVLPSPSKSLDEVKETPLLQESMSWTPVKSDVFVYALMVLLLIFLLATISWGLFLRKKIKRLLDSPVDVKVSDQFHSDLVAPRLPLGEQKDAVRKNKLPKGEKLVDLNPT